jgi:hypothetical protein
MPTLHIEHAIVDFALWQRAFDGFAEARSRAGVLAHRIQQPPDDPHYVMIDLDFATVDQAEAFLAFLRERVWAVPANSPALVGAPSTSIQA